MATETKEKARENAVGKASTNGAGVALTGGSGEKVESKPDKFKRLANMRVLKILDALDNVGNLANTNTYEYTKEQADHIVKLLRDRVAFVESRFAGKVEASATRSIF